MFYIILPDDTVCFLKGTFIGAKKISGNLNVIFKFYRGFSIIVFSYFINTIIWLTLVTDNKEVVEIFKKCFHFMAWQFFAPGNSVFWFASITMTKKKYNNNANAKMTLKLNKLFRWNKNSLYNILFNDIQRLLLKKHT